MTGLLGARARLAAVAAATLLALTLALALALALAQHRPAPAAAGLQAGPAPWIAEHAFLARRLAALRLPGPSDTGFHIHALPRVFINGTDHRPHPLPTRTMTTTNTWRSSTTVRATPEHVIDTLTDLDACARWSPIPFSVDRSESAPLRPGTTTRVSGRLLGAHVRFNLHTLVADPGRLHLHARGPIDILVDYTLKPIRAGCAVDARIAIHPPNSRFGRLLARATGLLLATGTLDHALNRIAHEAELATATSSSPAGGLAPAQSAAPPARAGALVCDARCSDR